MKGIVLAAAIAHLCIGVDGTASPCAFDWKWALLSTGPDKAGRDDET